MNRTATLPSRRWRATIAAAAVVVASLAFPAGRAAADVTFNQRMLQLVNEARSANGLAPVAAEPTLGGATMNLQVTGRGGVPATGVSAVVVNVTVTQPTAPSFLTVFPAGEALPLAANLNYGPSQTVPNLVTTKLGANGQVSIYNAAGSTHVVADVAGWYGTE